MVLGLGFVSIGKGLPGSVVVGKDIASLIAGAKGVAQDTQSSCASTSFPCSTSSDVGKLCGNCTGGKNMDCAPINPEIDCTIKINQYCCTVTQQCYYWFFSISGYFCGNPDPVAGPASHEFWNRTTAFN